MATSVRSSGLPVHQITNLPEICIRDGLVYVTLVSGELELCHCYTMHNFMALFQIIKEAICRWEAEQRGVVPLKPKRRHKSKAA